MNALKDLLIFCRTHDLNPYLASSWDAMERDRIGVLRILAPRPLTLAEVDHLTGGAVGEFTVPCPYCGADKFYSRRLRIRRPTLNEASWHCFYCGEHGSHREPGPIDPIAEAKARRLTLERERALKIEKTARAMSIWNEAVPIAATPVTSYLRARGINDLPPNVDGVLRYHPRCPFEKSTAPCMVALLRDVNTDEKVAIHRTWITRDGVAVGRMALGPIARAAVKLWPRDGDRLCVGEGIETVLSAATRDDVIRWREPLRPAWALTVANNLKYLPVIDEVQHLRVLVDNDASGVGQKAANACALSWRRSQRNVTLLTPRTQGEDFNDIVRRRAAS